MSEIKDIPALVAAVEEASAVLLRAKGMTPSVLYSEHEQAVMDADAGDAQEPPADRTRREP
jgi:hypothetical protein